MPIEVKMTWPLPCSLNSGFLIFCSFIVNKKGFKSYLAFYSGFYSEYG